LGEAVPEELSCECGFREIVGSGPAYLSVGTELLMTAADDVAPQLIGLWVATSGMRGLAR
jgi:hypothetical protein